MSLLLISALCYKVLGGETPLLSPFHTDFIGQVDWVEKQIVDLEQAMPPEKFTWRPADGVRSVSEVYLHVAFANYMLLRLAGFEPPAELKLTGDIRADVKNWDESTTDKAAIAEALKKSFGYVRMTVEKVTDLEKKVDFFGQQVTTRSILFVVLNHMHEHLGQSIAYARMNGVVPPWTVDQ
jgi:uncharacterized damage-inducible protein DinB